MNPLVDDRLVPFLLYDVAGAEALSELPFFADHSRETFDLYVEACRRVAREVLFPAYRPMDEEPPRFEDGRIRVHPAMRDIYPKLVELGALAATRPAEVGGQQLPVTVATVAHAYLMAANLSAYGYVGLTTGAAHLIESFGDETLRRTFMARMYAGEWTGTMALTEPQAGSSLADVATTAVPAEDGAYRLRGSKIFISGAAPKADEGEVDELAVTGDLGSADHYGPYQGEIEIGVTEMGALTHRNPYHLWLFEGVSGDELFVDLASRAGDDTLVMLYVEGYDGWDFVAYNDDCSSGTLNSCLDVTVTEDRDYLVLATTYSYGYYRRPTPAEYHLMIHCRAGSCASDPGAGEGEPCGGIAGIACQSGLVCDYSGNETCGADLAGVCVVDEPIFCTAHYDPVCGCDGRTYSNLCYLRAAHVAFDHDGECGSPTTGADVGETCGGIAAIRCRSGLVCDYSGNDWSGSGICPADEGGVCAHEREILCTEEYAPVCGCDGVTYSNDCHRRAAYASLAYTGA